ncbi:hypothetical protein FF1_028306 [Malus domestica]
MGLPIQVLCPKERSSWPWCCEKEGGHSDPDDDEWIGVALVKDCGTCGAVGKHRTEDCPKKKGTGKIHRKTALRKKKRTSVPRKKTAPGSKEQRWLEPAKQEGDKPTGFKFTSSYKDSTSFHYCDK